MIALLCVVQPYLKHCVQVWVPQNEKDIKLLKSIQRRVMTMGKALECTRCTEGGWGPLVHSAWRKEGWGEASSQPTASLRTHIRQWSREAMPPHCCPSPPTSQLLQLVGKHLHSSDPLQESCCLLQQLSALLAQAARGTLILIKRDMTRELPKDETTFQGATERHGCKQTT